MSIGSIFSIVALALFIFWVLGIAVIAYHVFKYRLPNDFAASSFWIFLSVESLAFLYFIFSFSGLFFKVRL